MSTQDIIVLAETHQDALDDITLELLGGARQLAQATGGEVLVLVLGRDGARHAEALSAADRIVIIDDPQLEMFSPEPYLAVLSSLIASENPRAVLVGSTSIGLDVGPTLAARLDAPIVIGCQRIEAEADTLRVTSSVCGGKMLGDVEVTAAPAILIVLPGSFRPCDEPGRAQVEKTPSPVSLQPGAITFEQMILPEAGDVDITQEEVLVAVGAWDSTRRRHGGGGRVGRGAGRPTVRFPADCRPGLAAAYPPGRQIRHDRQAQVFPCPRR